MDRKALTLALFFIAIPNILGGATGEFPEPDSVIRTRAEEVQVIATVTDKQQRVITSLQPEQIQVLEDGQPVSKLASFYSSQSLPLRVTLLVDSSDSMSRNFDGERMAAQWLATRVLRSDLDTARVATFAMHVKSAEIGGDPLYHTALQNVQAEGQTALFDSLLTAMEQDSRDRRPARRIFLLFTDGEDTYSLHSLSDAISAAQRAGILVYSISMHNPRYEFPGDRVLNQLTRATGGRSFVLKNYSKLSAVLDAIDLELHSQYVLTFRPRPGASRTEFHRVELKLLNQPDWQVRARTGYYLSAD